MSFWVTLDSLIVLHLHSWFTGEKEIQGSHRVTGNIVSKQISFILAPDDNGAEYRCNATNPATDEPLLATKTLTVNCELEANRGDPCTTLRIECFILKLKNEFLAPYLQLFWKITFQIFLILTPLFLEIFPSVPPKLNFSLSEIAFSSTKVYFVLNCLQFNQSLLCLCFKFPSVPRS